jgi:SAM-dependent methyltransferase
MNGRTGAGDAQESGVAGEQIRQLWAVRVERYAREAAPRTRPFAEALVELAAPPTGAQVLDVACGPGVVAVEAARRVGPSGSVLATDVVADWEPYVHEAAAAAGVANVSFRTMPAEALELPDGAFDTVLCQFGLMFVSEPGDALREMRRVLRPGGTLGVAVWSVPERVGLFLVPRIVGPALPPVEGEALPSPMSMGEPGLIEGLVADAGFRDISVQLVTRFHELADPEEEWRQWGEDRSAPTGEGVATLPQRERERLHDAVIAALEDFRVGNIFRVPSEAIMVTAVK